MKVPRVHLLGSSAHLHVITSLPTLVAHPREDFQRDCKIAQHHTVVGEYGDTMCRSPPGIFWLESCEHCLSGHWF